MELSRISAVRDDWSTRQLPSRMQALMYKFESAETPILLPMTVELLIETRRPLAPLPVQPDSCTLESTIVALPSNSSPYTPWDCQAPSGSSAGPAIVPPEI